MCRGAPPTIEDMTWFGKEKLPNLASATDFETYMPDRRHDLAWNRKLPYLASGPVYLGCARAVTFKTHRQISRRKYTGRSATDFKTYMPNKGGAKESAILDTRR